MAALRTARFLFHGGRVEHPVTDEFPHPLRQRARGAKESGFGTSAVFWNCSDFSLFFVALAPAEGTQMHQSYDLRQLPPARGLFFRRMDGVDGTHAQTGHT